MSSGAEKRPEVDVAAIVEAGRRAGLTDCGVADVGPSDHAEHLDAWLARGSHASMAWMQRTAEIRKDLRSKWSWARTALVATLDYLHQPADRAQLSGVARYISRYARGQDYHDVFKQRLRGWAESVDPLVSGEWRWAPLVDTSAVLERELAERAGLGWFGKNTCLIGPRGNSWFFIGVLLTDLDVPSPDQKLSERCGTCTACIDACPTDAIEPWQIDSNRCISYLTIEHRDTVSDELAPKLEDWLFGCDVCQDVCPWNRRAEPATAADDPLALDPRHEEVSLAELAGMDDAAFRQRFRGTPLTRPKRRGMVRNALLVGANVGDSATLETARVLVDDPEPLVAQTARQVLRRYDAGPPVGKGTVVP